ncbi:MAG: SagB/ThcOx family dehydrogenase [bacterium]
MWNTLKVGMHFAIAAGFILGAIVFHGNPVRGVEVKGEPIKLPPPRVRGDISLEEALSRRRSVREYSSLPLSLGEVSQILWSAQGITSPQGFRTAPSAGATYPMEVYLIASRVDGLRPGVYRYSPRDHTLTMVAEGNLGRNLADAALGQFPISEAAANLVIAAIYERTTQRYRERGIRYVHMEAGHIAQNVYLQAEVLGLGTVCIGAFYDERVKALLGIEADPLYIMPIGKRR